MITWTMKRARTDADCGWLIRGADGRTVCHAQYEADARLIVDAVAAYENGTEHKED